MGMAASQARHLALVARKSNCEYEGQQINQARTALANQSANLFNQMLGLKVPVPPSTQDFTKTQYSYTDGLNASTIDSWQQLATPEEEYNYVVTSHYYTDKYTGSQKKMADPQIQYTTNGTIVSSAEMTTALKQLTAARKEYDKISDDYNKITSNYDSALAAAETARAAATLAQTAQQTAQTAFDQANTAFNTAKTDADNYYTNTYQPAETELNDAFEAYTNAQNAVKDIDSYKIEDKEYAENVDKEAYVPGTNNGYKIGDDTYTAFENLSDGTKAKIEKSLEALKENGVGEFLTSDVFYNDKTGYITFKNDLDKVFQGSNTLPRYSIASANTENSILNKCSELNDNIKTTENAYNIAMANFEPIESKYQELSSDLEEKRLAKESANAVLEQAKTQATAAEANKLTAETNLANAQAALNEANENYGPTVSAYENALTTYNSYQTPNYLGNCELTLLENLDEQQLAELKQVVTDMKNLDINPAINDCFDENGEYLGGIYQFKLNGVTYYTSFEDLNNSYESGTGINHIDDQAKLAYYNASFVSTRIEETRKALLETDGNGRFVSVRFGDDTMTYTLEVETITDNDAYKDAMNQYNYENAKYDKMIQDINAKTSIIQQQDQQLELRLKQLDTEHNALSTEIDAVSKVVSDNVEKSFKTFGG